MADDLIVNLLSPKGIQILITIAEASCWRVVVPLPAVTGVGAREVGAAMAEPTLVVVTIGIALINICNKDIYVRSINGVMQFSLRFS